MHYLKFKQKVPLGIEECWKFFSNPSNLKILTPEHLGFEITNDFQNEPMYEGQIITYKIRPVMNIPITWVTEITHVKQMDYFIDEQRFGPYQFWHHEHRFTPIVGGVEMTDILYYKMPFGALGKAINALKVKQDIEGIFSYREKKMEELFGCFTFDNNIRD